VGVGVGLPLGAVMGGGRALFGLPGGVQLGGGGGGFGAAPARGGGRWVWDRDGEWRASWAAAAAAAALVRQRLAPAAGWCRLGGWKLGGGGAVQ
jgi:hypothetical protein